MRRNWLLTMLCVIGFVGFFLSRTVWGPPMSARAESNTAPTVEAREDEEMSDAKRRYLSNQPRHWRQIVVKR